MTHDRKIAISALIFWTLYNSLFVSGLLIWIKASSTQWAWGIVPVFVFTCLMMAVTLGNQNRSRND